VGKRKDLGIHRLLSLVLQCGSLLRIFAGFKTCTRNAAAGLRFSSNFMPNSGLIILYDLIDGFLPRSTLARLRDPASTGAALSVPLR
jgi:hypothetical protein